MNIDILKCNPIGYEYIIGDFLNKTISTLYDLKSENFDLYQYVDKYKHLIKKPYVHAL